ncbi:hypothetical protein [Candidatus Spyradosoma sp. SGI.093]|uniref:hypothetical protein n=1 Tax=Candidatus Spyradosoma sp. SGI.093 TaxID=3420583 RepID=UPI003CFD8DD2
MKNLLLNFAFLGAATCAFAQEKVYDDEIDASSVSGTLDRPNAIGVKPFFALGLEDLYSNVSEKVDLYGLNFDYTRALVDGRSGSVELVGLCGFGYGEGSFSYYDYGSYYYHYNKAEFYLYSMNFAAGLNFRLKFGEAASIYVGPRLGVNMLSVRCEDGGSEETATSFGALYGGELGLEFHLAPDGTASLAFAVDYLASTATPEFDEEFEGELDAQSWLYFCVGMKFRF